MLERLDEEIARVSAELNKLRKQKLELLTRQMRELESGGSETFLSKKTFRKLPDQEIKELLQKVVEEAGAEGISALKASEQTEVAYARVRPLMASMFKKLGSGRNTRFVAKRKKQS